MVNVDVGMVVQRFLLGLQVLPDHLLCYDLVLREALDQLLLIVVQVILDVHVVPDLCRDKFVSLALLWNSRHAYQLLQSVLL